MVAETFMNFPQEISKEELQILVKEMQLVGEVVLHDGNVYFTWIPAGYAPKGDVYRKLPPEHIAYALQCIAVEKMTRALIAALVEAHKDDDLSR